MVSEVSILIPIYNFAIEQLVKELLAQCKKAGVRFEIICLDDASEPEFQEKNRKLKNLENVFYEELQVNISRAAIRNQLAQR
ncbi:MAG: glycosyltransferase, partial [Bacteroidota bacterium]|nr:glycosyltransferase [Bacteroidota bacterium]